jgi:hypothetical protein
VLIINIFVALLMNCGLQNDETLSSTWVVHEIETARLHAIPIIVVIDSDQQLPRQVIDAHMQKGFGWLFENQIVSYSMQGREVKWVKIQYSFCIITSHSH